MSWGKSIFVAWVIAAVVSVGVREVAGLAPSDPIHIVIVLVVLAGAVIALRSTDEDQ